MRYLYLFIVIVISSGYTYGQQAKDTLLVFFTTGFNDSVHIYLDNQKLYEVKIDSRSKTGWSDFSMIVPLTGSSKKLTLLNIVDDRKAATMLINKYRFLYVSKAYQKYDFVFSNSLDLPCGSN